MDKRQIPRVKPPSPAQIRRACREIRAGWCPATERQRRVNSRRLADGDKLTQWTPPVIFTADLDDVADTESQQDD